MSDTRSALLMVEQPNGARRVHFLDAHGRRCTMEMGSKKTLILSVDSLHPIALSQERVRELLPWLQAFMATGELEPDVVDHLINQRIAIQDFLLRNKKAPFKGWFAALRDLVGWKR